MATDKTNAVLAPKLLSACLASRRVGPASPAAGATARRRWPAAHRLQLCAFSPHLSQPRVDSLSVGIGVRHHAADLLALRPQRLEAGVQANRHRSEIGFDAIERFGR
jgi:hypothetical protein